MGIAPRRLWGWEPEEVHVMDVDEQGRKVVRVTREPEYDKEQYDLLAGLKEYEAGLGHHGLPLEETMSPDADPNNPDGRYMYVSSARRDWYDDAIEAEQQNWPEFSAARKFSAIRVER